MPNYVPYLALMVMSVSVLIGIFIHTKQFRTFFIYVAFAGIIYIFEIIIVILFSAYEYEPQITTIRYLDNMIGASVSNTFTVPTVATMISVYQLRFRWIAVFALLFGGVELGFVHLGVYAHHWWRVPYTVVSLLFYFSLTKWWVRRFLAGSRPIRAVTYYIYTMALVLTFMFAFTLSGSRLFEPGIFKDTYRDDIIFSALYGSGKALMITTAVFWFRNWKWLIPAAAIIVVTQYMLVRFDILHVYIKMPLYALIYFACCCVVIVLCYLARRSVKE